MRSLRLLALSLPLCALLLTGCAASVVTEAPRLQVPASLKSCSAEPAPPADSADDATLAGWIVDLAVAGQSCRSNLAAVVKVIGP